MRTDPPCEARCCLVTAALLFLAACDDGRDSSATRGEEQIHHVYNWTDYIAPSTIADFEARSGIKVVYDTYDASEVVETKLLTGNSGYDVVVSSGPTLRLVGSGALQKLDRSKLPKLANLDPRIMQLVATHDPGNLHVVPYLLGTTGIGYNPDKVEQACGTRTIDSLAAVFDPAIASKLAKCGVTWLDAPADMFQLAFIYLGLDTNSHRPEDRAAAEQLLVRVRPYVRYFHSAYAFLDYLMEPEVIAGVTNAVGQANANAASLPYVAEAIREDPSIYPTDEVFKRLTIDRSWSQDQMREIGRAWNRVKTHASQDAETQKVE